MLKKLLRKLFRKLGYTRPFGGEEVGQFFQTVFSFIGNFGKMGGGGGSGWIFAVLILAAIFAKKKKKKADPVAIAPAPTYDSPTYSFGGGITTVTADDNLAVAMVFGHHIIGGAIVNSYLKSNSFRFSTVDKPIIPTSEVYNVTANTYLYKFVVPADDGLATAITLNPKLHVGTSGNIYNRYKTAIGNTAVNSRVTIKTCNTIDGVYIDRLTTSLNYWGYNLSGSLFGREYSFLIHDLALTGSLTMYVKITIENVKVSVAVQIPNRGSVNQIVEMPITTTMTSIDCTSTKFIGQNNANVNSQRLYLDVILSSDEILSLNNVWLNDKEVSNLWKEITNAETIKAIDYKWKPGFSYDPLSNIDESFPRISTVFNQSDYDVDKRVGAIIESGENGNLRKIFIDDPTPFQVGYKLSLDTGRLTEIIPPLTVTEVGTDYIVYSADRSWSAETEIGKPIYIWDTNSPSYSIFQYTTQNEELNEIDIGINCPEGLFNQKLDTGALEAKRVSYELKVAPITYNGSATTFPLNDLSKLCYNQTIECQGSKRAKLWFCHTITSLELANNNPDNCKKFMIELKKVTDNCYLDTARNKFQVAYVQEILNQDICYNGNAYATLTIDANSKVNNSSPNLKFDINGILVPQRLHETISVNNAGQYASTTRVYLSTNITQKNYINASGTEYTLMGPLIDAYTDINTGTRKVYSLLKETNFSSVEIDNVPYIRQHYRTYASINETFTNKYFKAQILGSDNKWYFRYVTLMQEHLYGDLDNPENYVNYFEIKDFSTETSTLVDNEYLKATNTPLPTGIYALDILVYLWSDNPAWSLLYLLTNEEFGAGISLSNIDIESFQEAAAYFDEMIPNPITTDVNDKITRCRLNYVIDSFSSFREHIQKILTTCHAALYESDEKIKLLVEKKLIETFDEFGVLLTTEFVTELDEETDLIELKVSSIPTKELPNQLIITYLDENKKFDKETIIIEDPMLNKSKGYSAVIRSDMDLFGLTNEAHVFIEGLKILKTTKYVRFAIQIKTALSGLPLEVYNGFKLTSSTHGWTKKKFRCVGIKVNEKKECEIDAVEYWDEIFDIAEEDIIKYNEAIHTSLPSPYQIPSKVVDLRIWEENLRNADGSVSASISGSCNFSNSVPENRVEYAKTDGILVSVYDITHILSGNNTVYPVMEGIKFDSNYFNIPNVRVGKTYKVSVRAINNYGLSGEPVASTIIVEGKKLKPERVSGLSHTVSSEDSAKYIYTWNPLSNDKDLSCYAIKVGTTAQTWETADQITVFQMPEGFINVLGLTTGFGIVATQVILQFLVSGTYRVFLKGLDTSGNYSEFATYEELLVKVEPEDVIGLSYTAFGDDKDKGMFKWSQLLTAKDLKDYVIKVGSSTDTWATASSLFTDIDIVESSWSDIDGDFFAASIPVFYSILQFKVSGTYRLFVRGRDKHNNLSLNATYIDEIITVEPATITGFTATAEEKDPDIYSVFWNELPDNEAILTYDIRVGSSTSTWANAHVDMTSPNNVIVTPTQGSSSPGVTFIDTGTVTKYTTPFFSKNVNSIKIHFNTSGTYKLHIKALDKNNHYSAVSSITKVVTVEPVITGLLVEHVNSNDNFPFLVSWNDNSSDTIQLYNIAVGKTTNSTYASGTQVAAIAKQGDGSIQHSQIIDAFNIQNLTKRLDYLDETTLRIFVCALDRWGKYSSNAFYYDIGISAVPPDISNLILEQSKEHNKIGRITASWEFTPIHSYLTHSFEVNIGYSATPGDPANNFGEGGFKVAKNIVAKTYVYAAEDGNTLYVHVRSLNQFEKYGAWVSSSITLNCKPSVVNIANIKTTSTANSISLDLPDQSGDFAFLEYEIHISTTNGFTPSIAEDITKTRIAKGPNTNVTITQLPNGAVLNGATTYYLKVRSLSIYGLGFTSVYSTQFSINTSDSTAPVIILNSTTPSIDPINVILTSTIYVDFTATDNTAINYVKGRVFKVGTSNPAWTNPIVSGDYLSLLPGGPVTDGDYVLQLIAYDNDNNAGNLTRNFSRDTAVAVDPTAVTASLLSNVGVMASVEVSITQGSVPNFKEFVIQYAVNTGSGYSAWAEIRKTSATTFVESISISGFVKFRVKATKLHSATLDSGWIVSNELAVDNIGPTIQLDYSTPSVIQSVLIPSNTITLHFLATDGSELKNTGCVEYSVNGGTYSVATTIVLAGDKLTASGTVVLSSLANQQYSVVLRAIDAVGNATFTPSFTFAVDQAKPADVAEPLCILTPGNNRMKTFIIPGFTKCTNYGWTEFRYYNATTDVEIDLETSTNDRTVHTFDNDLAYQVYIKARQVKSNGITRDWDTEVLNPTGDYWVDTTPPEVSITNLYTDAGETIPALNGQNFLITDAIYLSYVVTDATSGVLDKKYRFSCDTLIGSWTTLTASPMSITIPAGYQNKEVTLEIKGRDIVENTSTKSIKFWLDTYTPANTNTPTITVTGRTVTINVTYTPTSNFKTLTYAIYRQDTNALLVEINSVDSTTEYTFAADYAYQVYAKVKQVKNSGVAGSYSSASNNVWIDIVPPTLTIGTIPSINELGYCKTNPISLTASATDASSGILSLQASIDGGAYASINNGTASSITLGSDSLIKNLTIRALDNNNNVTYFTKTFVLDTAAPTGFTLANISYAFGRTIKWSINMTGVADATSGIGGIEIRASATNFGVDNLYMYKGLETTFTQFPSSGASSTVYFSVFDKAGNYCAVASATAVNLAPADVTGILGQAEINAVIASWTAVTTNNNASVADDIFGYVYTVLYKNLAGVYTNESASFTTQDTRAFIPIPLALILPNQVNSLKIKIQAIDVWGKLSDNIITSSAFDTRKIESADISGNAFQFVVKSVQQSGVTKVSVSTNGLEVVDPLLLLITDGDFNND